MYSYFYEYVKQYVNNNKKELQPAIDALAGSKNLDDFLLKFPEHKIKVIDRGELK